MAELIERQVKEGDRKQWLIYRWLKRKSEQFEDHEKLHDELERTFGTGQHVSEAWSDFYLSELDQ